MEEKWLKCRIFKGMFSDEVVVECDTTWGSPMSAFVPRATVRGRDDEEGRLKVQVFRSPDDGLWAVLPTEYQDSIPIQEADLIPA